MDRLTRILNSNGFYVVNDDKVNCGADGYFGDAINKLAMFENIYDDLVANQIEISKQLETLRNEGKTHSVKFKELMAKKLTNNYTISLFKAYGLE